MKVGDKLVCVASNDSLYTVGSEYEIECFDSNGEPCLRDNHGGLEEGVGQPLKGNCWSFEEVK